MDNPKPEETSEHKLDGIVDMLEKLEKIANPVRLRALTDVVAERSRQVHRWGDHHDDQHNHHDWIALLNRYASDTAGRYHGIAFRDSMQRVAAMAMAAVEWCDRQPLQSSAPYLYSKGLPLAEIQERCPGWTPPPEWVGDRQRRGIPL